MLNNLRRKHTEISNLFYTLYEYNFTKCNKCYLLIFFVTELRSL